MKKENRTILKVVTWLLVTLVLWLTCFLGDATKSLGDFDVNMIPFAITGLCILLIGSVITNENNML